MLILLAVVAFAWLMGLNLYILLYQQRNVALIAYLRTYYPDIYEKSKNRLSFGMLATDAQTRNALRKAMGDATLQDPNIEAVTTLRRGHAVQTLQRPVSTPSASRSPKHHMTRCQPAAPTPAQASPTVHQHRQPARTAADNGQAAA